jgi:hypothetical protein
VQEEIDEVAMASFSLMLMSNMRALFVNAAPVTKADAANAKRHLKLEKAKLAKQIKEDYKVERAERKEVSIAPL